MYVWAAKAWTSIHLFLLVPFGFSISSNLEGLGSGVATPGQLRFCGESVSTSGRVGLPGYGFQVAHGDQVGQKSLFSYVK